MGRLPSKSTREQDRDDGPVVRIPHAEPAYLVSPCWGQEWVNCPVCGAKPDGWEANGEPRYNGGSIEASIPQRDRTELVDVICACRCFVGDQVARALNVRYFDELPPATVFVSRASMILFKRGESHGYPPKEEPRPGSRQYQEGMSREFQRCLRGEISNDEFQANARALEVKYMPPRNEGPRIEDLVSSPALRDLYLPARPKNEEPVAAVASDRSPYKD